MRKKRSKTTGNAKSRGETDPSGRAIPVHKDEPSPTENGGPAHPHDRLFKEVFSTIEAQQDLVRMALPDAITSRFRMDTVRDAGQETGSGRIDLLLTVETIHENTEYVYVLVEHKSYPAPLVAGCMPGEVAKQPARAVQLLGYVAGIMKKHGNAPVPVIHPVVFYHGAETWTAPTELTGLHQTVESAESDGPPKEAGRNDENSSRREPPGGYPVNLRYHLFDLEKMVHRTLAGNRE